MAPKILIKRSETSNSPNTEFGELAYTSISNVNNVYIGDPSGSPILIAGDGKMNTVPAATADNIASFTASGQVKDSGFGVETSALSGSAGLIPSSEVILNELSSIQQNLCSKQFVMAATTEALPAVSAAGSGSSKTLTSSLSQTLSVDGVSTWIDVNNDGGLQIPENSGVQASRVLVKDQANAADNGIYVVLDKGSSVTPFILKRTPDFDAPSEIQTGAFTFAKQGTINGQTGFICTTTGAVTMESTAITFAPFSGAGSITAGTGLAKTGNTILISNGGVTETQINTSAIGDGLTGGGGTPIAVEAGVNGAISVGSGGIAVNVDGASIGVNGLNQLTFLGSTSAITRTVTQAAHPFQSVGQIAALSTSGLALAQADASLNAVVVGIVTNIISANQFSITESGYVTGLAGLVAGTVYYLSPTVAGGLTSTPPTTIGQIFMPLLFADSTTSGYFYTNPGNQINTSTATPVFTDNAEITTSSALSLAGGMFCINSTASTTQTLPALANVTGGTVFIISQINTGKPVINTNGVDTFADGTNSITLLQNQGDSITIIAHKGTTTSWIIA